MVRRWVIIVGMALLVGTATAQDTTVLEGETERLSYALGMNIWSQLQDHSVEVDLERYIQGFRDAQSGNKTLLNEAEVDEILNALKQQQLAQRVEKPIKNKQAGETFLTGNKTREGVVTLESGLQYRIIKTGIGDKPAIDDRVVVHYRGTLIDGTEFDSSYRRGQPATFAVNRVIRGWTEALQLMPTGSKWQLFVPADLAYGKRGTGRQIGPNATLVFEVELIAIKRASEAGTRTSADSDKAVAADKLKDIQVSFKLDSRLTRSLYMGDRWVSPPTYTGTRQVGKEYTVEVRAKGIDVRGRHIPVNPHWIASDPEMVVLSPARGEAVKITVRRAGESMLKLKVAEFSRNLIINAKREDDALQVKISQ